MLSDRNVTSHTGRLRHDSIVLHFNQNEKYEIMVAMQDACGSDIGELNHSNNFCSSFTKTVYTILRARMAALFRENVPGTGRPPPFAVVANKMTPNKRTSQIVGVIAFLDGRILALNVSFHPTTTHTCIGVASAVYSAISTEFPTDLNKR